MGGRGHCKECKKPVNIPYYQTEKYCRSCWLSVGVKRRSEENKNRHEEVRMHKTKEEMLYQDEIQKHSHIQEFCSHCDKAINLDEWFCYCGSCTDCFTKEKPVCEICGVLDEYEDGKCILCFKHYHLF